MSIISILPLILSRLFLFILIASIMTITKRINPQTSTNFVPKRGGICFRIDDNNAVSRFSEFAAVFNKYNQHFCFAINLGAVSVTPEYIDGLKQIQAQGHELMDHTPQHGTSYFRTLLPADYYLNHPGVHEIASNGRVMLKYAEVDISCAERSGYASISKDTVRGMFTNFSVEDCYLYFPSLDKLVFIHPSAGWINENTVKVTDFWQNTVN